MQHLDEGSLAEFLDEGARQERQAPERRRAVAQHLERCAECRERLEAARTARERARGILAAASPDPAPAPSFGAIRARARGAGGRARGFPYRAVGLAAAVMLVAGVTWVVVSPAPPIAEEQALAPPPVPAESERAAGAADAAAAAEAPAETAPARNEARQTPAPAAPVPEPTRQLAEAAKQALPGAGAAAGPDTAAPAAGERAALAVEDQREAVPALARSDLAADRWRPVSRAEAERLLDGPVATVPDLPILSHQVLQDPGPATVRTVQAMADGVELELIQRWGELEPDTPAVVPSARMRALDADAASTMSVRFDGFVVTGRGRVGLDSLRVLLERLRG